MSPQQFPSQVGAEYGGDWPEELPAEVLSVTLLGAMVCNDYVVLASDSEAGRIDGYKESVSKLWHQNAPSVAWGIAGNEVPGLDFVARMKGTDWTKITTWEALRKASQRCLREANLRVKEDLRDMQMAFGFERSMAHALVAAVLENRPAILALRADTPATFVKEGYAFFGVEELGATLVVEALRQERGDRFRLDESLLQTVMENAAAHVQGIGAPIRMVQINREGVVQLK